MNTQLTNYKLWFDGMITIEPQLLVDYLNSIDKVSVTHVTRDIEKYNKLIGVSRKITTKTALNDIINDWNIPAEYKKLDIDQAINIIHDNMAMDYEWTTEELNQRQRRIEIEQRLFAKHGLYPLLRALFFVINTLKQKDIVWGTGRGSSVSSYILYILEVHDVDSFSFQLDITDFLK